MWMDYKPITDFKTFLRALSFYINTLKFGHEGWWKQLVYWLLLLKFYLSHFNHGEFSRLSPYCLVQEAESFLYLSSEAFFACMTHVHFLCKLHAVVLCCEVFSQHRNEPHLLLLKYLNLKSNSEVFLESSMEFCCFFISGTGCVYHQS